MVESDSERIPPLRGTKQQDFFLLKARGPLRGIKLFYCYIIEDLPRGKRVNIRCLFSTDRRFPAACLQYSRNILNRSRAAGGGELQRASEASPVRFRPALPHRNRSRRAAIAALLLSFAAAGSAASQILNIEQERIQTDTTGWSGSARAAFDCSKNRESFFNVTGGVHLQFKTERDLFLLLGEYGLVRAGGADFTNQGIGHFRFNRRLSRRWTAEAFVQGQSNRILNVRFRGLAGAGPRFRAVKTERFRLYAAALGMFEYEESGPADAAAADIRVSQYLSWTWIPSDAFKVVHTTYWQPRLWDPADYRISSQTDFISRVTRTLSLAVSGQIATDSRPAAGAVRTVYSVRNILSFALPVRRRVP